MSEPVESALLCVSSVDSRFVPFPPRERSRDVAEAAGRTLKVLVTIWSFSLFKMPVAGLPAAEETTLNALLAAENTVSSWKVAVGRGTAPSLSYD